MSVTILAIIFIIGLLIISLLGYRGIIKRGKPVGNINEERCTLCGKQFNRAQMVERQIGDYRLYYFCSSCIADLHHEMISKN